MPIYVFKHPEKEEYKEAFFSMNDEKSLVIDGIEWQRVYNSPNLNTEASIDPWSTNDFVNKTQDKKGSLGDIMDASAELSNKRAESNGGVDPIKSKYFDNYSKKRNGAKHHLDKSNVESKNFKIDY